MTCDCVADGSGGGGSARSSSRVEDLWSRRHSAVVPAAATDAAPATGTDTDTAPDTAGWRGGAVTSEVLAALGAALKIARRGCQGKRTQRQTDSATAAGPASDPEVFDWPCRSRNEVRDDEHLGVRRVTPGAGDLVDGTSPGVATIEPGRGEPKAPVLAGRRH